MSMMDVRGRVSNRAVDWLLNIRTSSINMRIENIASIHTLKVILSLLFDLCLFVPVLCGMISVELFSCFDFELVRPQHGGSNRSSGAQNVDRPFVCFVANCSADFAHQRYLEQHLRNVHGVCICPLCL